MEEIVNIRVKQQVNIALTHRNGPIVTPIHDTPLNSPVLVWREENAGCSGNWTGPFKLLRINGETCCIELSSGPTDVAQYADIGHESGPVRTRTGSGSAPRARRWNWGSHTVYRHRPRIAPELGPVRTRTGSGSVPHTRRWNWGPEANRGRTTL